MRSALSNTAGHHKNTNKQPPIVSFVEIQAALLSRLWEKKSTIQNFPCDGWSCRWHTFSSQVQTEPKSLGKLQKTSSPTEQTVHTSISSTVCHVEGRERLESVPGTDNQSRSQFIVTS